MTPNPPSGLRRIACISTSRADAGIYRPLLRALAAEARWSVFLLAGGTHGVQEYGDALDDHRRIAGLTIVPVEHQVPGDTPVAVAESAGRAVPAFASAIDAVRPDLVFVLGDRAEMLAASLAAVIARVPIAHLHGGDLTRGAYDDQCRNAITKLARLHFPALPEHADRIRAMGEDPARIHVVGALALDELAKFRPEPIAELSAAVGLDFAKPTCVVVYHPETLSHLDAGAQMDIVLDALAGLPATGAKIAPSLDHPAPSENRPVPPADRATSSADRRIPSANRPASSVDFPKSAADGRVPRDQPRMQFLFLAPNADVGRGAIAQRLGRLSTFNSQLSVFSFQFSVFPSLPQHRFWSCLHHARVLIGNSSAGLLEAASLKLPVVNIGNRQSGRLAPPNVISAAMSAENIRDAIRRALHPDFRLSLRDLVNPYGDGRAAERIVSVLSRA